MRYMDNKKSKYLNNTKYDKTIKRGKTTVHIVSPETMLGRKMTDEEIKVVLDEVKRVNIEIYKYIYINKQQSNQ